MLGNADRSVEGIFDCDDEVSFENIDRLAITRLFRLGT